MTSHPSVEPPEGSNALSGIQTRILEPTPAHLQLAAQTLLQADLVAMPTETVYGLAGNALDPGAVAKIFAAKERPNFDPLIVHIASTDTEILSQLEHELVDLSSFTTEARIQLGALLYEFWPGPLTVVLPKTPQVPDLVTSGLSTVALRMPRHPIAQALLQTTGIPLAAPSANRFGRISPTTAAAVLAELEGRIPWILDGGPCQVGLESTVILCHPQGSATLLRPGGIPLEEIRQLIPIQQRQAGPTLSPGMLTSHYAPTKPLRMLPTGLADLPPGFWEEHRARSIGILMFMGDGPAVESLLLSKLGIRAQVEVLSAVGDLAEAARTLFAKLRRLDEGETEVLLAEPCPVAAGLGHAIADRLRRASYRTPG